MKTFRQPSLQRYNLEKTNLLQFKVYLQKSHTIRFNLHIRGHRCQAPLGNFNVTLSFLAGLHCPNHVLQSEMFLRMQEMSYASSRLQIFLPQAQFPNFDNKFACCILYCFVVCGPPLIAVGPKNSGSGKLPEVRTTILPFLVIIIHIYHLN